MAGDWYCGTLNCGESFDTEPERLNHYVQRSHGTYQHPSERYCKPCNLVYSTSVQLDTHRREGHRDAFCFTCTLYFKSFDLLKAHMKQAHEMILPSKKASVVTVQSSASQGPGAGLGGGQSSEVVLSTAQTLVVVEGKKEAPVRGGAHTIVNRHISCRVKGCEGMFKSPSGVAHHLESGVHENIHRHTVTAVAQTMDLVPSVSLNKRNALDASTITPLISHLAENSSFKNGYFRCTSTTPKCRRKFKTLAGLDAHLNSAAHDDVEFKCPKEKCGRHFTLISALIQHIESEKCGLTNMVEIQRWFDHLAAQFDRLLR